MANKSRFTQILATVGLVAAMATLGLPASKAGARRSNCGGGTANPAPGCAEGCGGGGCALRPTCPTCPACPAGAPDTAGHTGS